MMNFTLLTAAAACSAAAIYGADLGSAAALTAPEGPRPPYSMSRWLIRVLGRRRPRNLPCGTYTVHEVSLWGPGHVVVGAMAAAA